MRKLGERLLQAAREANAFARGETVEAMRELERGKDVAETVEELLAQLHAGERRT
jgi:hypothetical protein